MSPPGPPASPPGPPYAVGRRRSPVGWILALLAVLVVAAVVVALVVRGLGSGGLTSDPTTRGSAPSADVCPPTTSSTTGAVTQPDGRVRSGALSYPRLDDPFDAPHSDSRVPFGRDVQSQQATVEEVNGEPTWVAAVLIARLLAGDGFFGPEQGARVVANCVTGSFYGNAAVTRTDSVNQAIRVDGRDAWTIEAHLGFELPDVKTIGETMIIVVVDTGNGEAGLFYASIPDTSPQYMAPARAALADLRVTA